MLRRWSIHERSRQPSWVAAVLCVAWLAEPVAVAAHDAATGHTICEHGALVDISADAAPGVGETEPRAVVGPAFAESAAHSHCATALTAGGREGLVHASPELKPVVPAPLKQVRLAPASPTIAPVVVAPKTSPPQAASI